MISHFKNKLSGIFLVAIVFPAWAQITGNLNVRDPKALKITTERIQMLCGKEWWGLQLNETKRGEKEVRDIRETIKLLCNGEVDGKNGKWEVINSQFIKITRPSERRYSHFILNGAYSIYEISDTTLVIAQILTSNGDWVKELTFTSSQDYYHRSHPKPSYSNYWNQEQQPGEKITRYDNGTIGSKEYYKAVKRKLSATELFEFGVPPDRYDLTDSTKVDIIPIGDWFFYYSNGKIKSTSHYDSSGKPTGSWTTYLPDGKIDRIEHRGGDNFYSDQYEYRSDGSLLHVKQKFEGKNEIYVIGKKDSIGIPKVEFFLRERAGTYKNEITLILNFSEKEVKLFVAANKSLGIAATNFNMRSKDFFVLELPMTIPQGSQENFLSLSTNEWNYKIKIHSFGFDLTTSDFESEKSVTLPTTFYFYLEPEGYQLEMTPLSNPTRKNTIPISQQLTEIQLKKDKYQLTLYSPSGKRTILVDVK